MSTAYRCCRISKAKVYPKTGQTLPKNLQLEVPGIVRPAASTAGTIPHPGGASYVDKVSSLSLLGAEIDLTFTGRKNSRLEFFDFERV